MSMSDEKMTTEGEDCVCLKLGALLFGRGLVHPSQPVALEHSEYLQVSPRVKIRVLHVKPETYSEVSFNFNIRNSLTEEYWFTRWNKPLRAGSCNCSFRRSLRYSKISQNLQTLQLSTLNESNKMPSIDDLPTKIIDVSTFAERLTEETLLEAFQEYYISKAKKMGNGVDNLGYIPADETDGVILRKPKKPEPAILPTVCVPSEISNNNVKSTKHKCSQDKDKSENKPLVILLHGIGSTADVWWNVIKSLLNRGFEIVAPDMLGHGYSSAPRKQKAYKFKKLLNQTLAVFDNYAQKDEKRKFIIIGHSFGCSIATALARYRPQQIVQLVLISGGGPTALSAPVTGNEISMSGCLQVLISPLLFCGLKRSIFYSSRGKHFKPCDTDTSIPKYVLNYINRGQDWPEGDAAFHRRILIPTLLVHGLKDTQVTLVQECEMERTIPRAFLELIPTAGHMSLLETPEQLNHMILCFVEWWAR